MANHVTLLPVNNPYPEGLKTCQYNRKPLEILLRATLVIWISTERLRRVSYSGDLSAGSHVHAERSACWLFLLLVPHVGNNPFLHQGRLWNTAGMSRLPRAGFFDFGAESALWWLFPKGADGWSHVAKFSRTEFVEIHRRGTTQKIDEFAKFLQDIPDLVASYNSPQPQNDRSLQSQSFQQYLARKELLTRETSGSGPGSDPHASGNIVRRQRSVLI